VSRYGRASGRSWKEGIELGHHRCHPPLVIRFASCGFRRLVAAPYRRRRRTPSPPTVIHHARQPAARDRSGAGSPRSARGDPAGDGAIRRLLRALLSAGGNTLRLRANGWRLATLSGRSASLKTSGADAPFRSLPTAGRGRTRLEMGFFTTVIRSADNRADCFHRAGVLRQPKVF